MISWDKKNIFLFVIIFFFITILFKYEFNDHGCVIDLVGVEPAQVQERVENHLKNLLIKHFDPQKADSIFTVEGEVWLFQLAFQTKSIPSIYYAMV